MMASDLQRGLPWTAVDIIIAMVSRLSLRQEKRSHTSPSPTRPPEIFQYFQMFQTISIHYRKIRGDSPVNKFKTKIIL